MLYNLEELESNLHVLLGEFEQLKDKMKHMRDSQVHNKAAVLLRMPKLLLLQDVMVYLTDHEVIVLSSVCRMLRRLVYSPIGWKVLSYSRLPIRIRYSKEKVEENAEQELEFNEQAMTFSVEQIKVLKQKKILLGDNLRREYEMYCSSKEKYEGILDKVRVEKKLQQKYRDKGKILDEEIILMEQINGSYRENLRQLNDEFEGKMKHVNDEENKLVAERQKLQNQKEALVGKIR